MCKNQDSESIKPNDKTKQDKKEKAISVLQDMIRHLRNIPTILPDETYTGETVLSWKFFELIEEAHSNKTYTLIVQKLFFTPANSPRMLILCVWYCQ